MEKDTLATIAIILGFALLIAVYVIAHLWERRKELNNLVYLFEAGWKFHKDKPWYDSEYTVIAPDESNSRRLSEAVQRQKEFDRIKKLNLPDEALKIKRHEIEAPAGELEKWKTD